MKGGGVLEKNRQSAIDCDAPHRYNKRMDASSGRMILDVGCAIIRRGSQLLIAQRKPEDHLGGFWEFPGGKKRRQETLEECLVREAEEELGIIIVPAQFFRKIEHSYPERVLALHFYLCDWKSGDPVAIDCHDFRWIFPEALREFQFPPADDGIIEELILNKALHFRSIH